MLIDQLTFWVLFSNIFSYRVSVAILRMPHGLDYSLILNNGLSNMGYVQSNNGSLNELDESVFSPTLTREFADFSFKRSIF